MAHYFRKHELGIQSHCLPIAMALTRHRLGGRIQPPPPRFFRNNFFIYYCIDMKLGTPLLENSPKIEFLSQMQTKMDNA